MLRLRSVWCLRLRTLLWWLWTLLRSTRRRCLVLLVPCIELLFLVSLLLGPILRGRSLSHERMRGLLLLLPVGHRRQRLFLGSGWWTICIGRLLRLHRTIILRSFRSRIALRTGGILLLSALWLGVLWLYI
jgi:hypothetical protein